MSNDSLNNYNVRNILVHKDKNSDFLEFYRNHPILSKCPFKNAPYSSGPYYIYTLDNVYDEERDIIKEHQDGWI